MPGVWTSIVSQVLYITSTKLIMCFFKIEKASLLLINLRHDCDLDRDTVDPRLSEPHLSEPSIIRITKLTIFIAFVVCIK